jgi:hypothetical protein
MARGEGGVTNFRAGRDDDTPGAGPGRTPSLWDRLRGQTGDQPRPPAPWRVEGMADGPSSRAPDQRPRRGGFWWFVLAVPVLNWSLMSRRRGASPAARAMVSAPPRGTLAQPAVVLTS